MLLYYSLFDFSELDKTVEYDLSKEENGSNGIRVNFPTSLSYTDKFELGPPASYDFIGSSSIIINNLVIEGFPLTFSFWVKVGSIPQEFNIFSAANGNLSIKVGTNRKIKINLTEFPNTILSNLSYDFITIILEEGKISLIKNGGNAEIVSASLPVSFGTSFTMLNNFSGKIADFRIHNKILSKDNINILYKSILSSKDKTILIEKIEEIKKNSLPIGREYFPPEERNSIERNKIAKFSSFCELANINDTGIDFNDSNFSFYNSLDIPPGTYSGIKFSIPINYNCLDSLIFFKIKIRLNLGTTKVSVRAINISGSSSYIIANRDYLNLSGGTDHILSLLFKPFLRNATQIEIYFDSLTRTINYSDISFINLTHSKTERYLHSLGIEAKIYSGDSYLCDNDILSWCDSNLLDLTFVNGIAEKNYPSNILYSSSFPEGDIFFSKLQGGTSICSEQIKEYNDIDF
jgi:hypothetical protein